MKSDQTLDFALVSFMSLRANPPLVSENMVMFVWEPDSSVLCYDTRRSEFGRKG